MYKNGPAYNVALKDSGIYESDTLQIGKNLKLLSFLSKINS
jgi:hypothetical protein